MLIVAAFAAAFIGAAGQTVAGFGIALAIAPVMFLLLDPPEAVVCTLGASTVLSLILLASERDRIDIDLADTSRLALGGGPGLVAGALLLGIVAKPPLQVLVGLIAIGVVVLQRPRPPSGATPAARGPVLGPVVPGLVGFTAGVLNAAVSTGGPPLAIWMRRVAETPDQIRHTLALLFIFLNAGAITATLAVEGIDPDREFTGALLAASAAIPAGYLAGRRVLARIEPRTFERIFVATIVAVATASLASGLGALL